ncbi:MULTISPECIES: hypothetical protein [unclassified Methylobacterium]|uniref:hypothetical protein n=1 Tax=unclassified Methylobacterium TaxID=2615210 RepID=UPI000CB840F8|nr:MULTISPECIES: hypothetical protein [unclassified Methylobacterium]PIU06617.1 MAG: hypothetical protein COT56_08785 [Methylobacterium sp. CG09_land_8_20_14_0_10_71_15]PIU12109.1 MAG: hypothetical protein COT28_16905 [Methylobacterium sp. CG08_land_8_20_14_0_20_71_15]GBU19689.1 hypothetical protein AwMethylo_39040 [Methylobacterium sp.]
MTKIKFKMTKSEIFTAAWERARAAALANGTSAKAEFAAALRGVYAARALLAARYAGLADALLAGRAA